MQQSTPASELIKRRFSCRAYAQKPLDADRIREIDGMVNGVTTGPMGSHLRMRLIAATDENREALKGLGTYGNIKHPAAYIAGAVRHAAFDLEDFGYAMERIVLFLTGLDLGTCWLGGLFTRSGFGNALSVAADEQIPAIVSVGIMPDPERAKKAFIRRLAGSLTRKPWEELFFDREYGKPVSPDAAGECAAMLEAVRIGPSASNKQPWRIVKGDRAWHFYLSRTKGYSNGIAARLVKMADIQRLDMGIAMCHWEMVAAQHGIRGGWITDDSAVRNPAELTHYVASWRIDR